MPLSPLVVTSRPTCRLFLILAICAATGMLWASSASADRYLTAKNALTPAGGVVGPDATAASGDFVCSVASATVANAPSGYAIGNCLTGWHLHRQLKSDLTPAGYYDGGKIYGDYAGCGWIGDTTDTMENNNAYNECPGSVGYNLGDFALYTDGCSGDNGCAGTPIDNAGGCYEYGNMHPWLSGQSAQDLYSNGYVAPHSTYNGAPRLAWRYVTKYATSDGWAQNFVMVRDRAHPTGTGNWVFVPFHCIFG